MRLKARQAVYIIPREKKVDRINKIFIELDGYWWSLAYVADGRASPTQKDKAGPPRSFWTWKNEQGDVCFEVSPPPDKPYEVTVFYHPPEETL